MCIQVMVPYNSIYIYVYTHLYIYVYTYIYVYHSSFNLSPWHPHCIPIGWILLHEEQICGVTAGTSKCTPQISPCYHALEPWEQPHTHRIHVWYIC